MKWRFATIVGVFEQLSPLREICEPHLRETLFSEAQDKVHITDVVKASRDPWLWKYIVYALLYMWGPLEELRRWGLMCDCHEQERAEKHLKHFTCDRNSRRIAGAWDHVEKVIAEFKERAKTLKPVDCEESQSLCTLLKGMCRKAADLLNKRYKYLGIVPWRLATADSVEGASACCEQIDAQAFDDHDPVTQDFIVRVGDDLRIRAAGGPCSERLAREVRALANTPLDESCGEGYHRDTTHEHHRAPGSTTIHLKRHTRHKKVVKTIRGFCKTYGQAGRRVLDYEYSHWQRILQTSVKHKWRVKRMHLGTLMKRIYREDAMADQDWSSIAQKVPVNRPVEPEEASSREQLEREYLCSVFQPLQFYSVERSHEAAGDAGEVERITEPRYFQILGAQHGHTKEKIMHTVQSADDVTRKMGLIFHVLFLDRWLHPDVGDDGVVRVHSDSDAECVRACEIADFNDLAFHCSHYRSNRTDTENQYLTVLSDAEAAKPRFPITDPRTPTLAVAWHLKHLGWVGVGHACEHSVVPDLASNPEFDHRESTRMKFYYVVLTRLETCLPLSGGRIPSQQPIAFYRLLLLGKETEPDLGNKAYVLAYNRALKDDKNRGDLMEPLEDVRPPPDDDGFFIRPLGAPEPKAHPGGHGPRGRGKNRGGGGGPTGRGSGGAAVPVENVPPGTGGAPGPSSLPPPTGIVCPGGAPPDPLVGEEDFYIAPLVPEVAPKGKARPKKEQDKYLWVDALDGCRASFQPYVDTKGKPSTNFVLKCPHHVSCEKSRARIPAHEEHFGPIEELAYLHAWSRIAWPTKPTMGTHRQETPSQAAVAEYARAHVEDLQAVLGAMGL